MKYAIRAGRPLGRLVTASPLPRAAGNSFR